MTFSWCVSGSISPTTVWKHECSCVRKGGLSCCARTLFSTMVHSTSSSWITTSFFRIFIAYSSSVAFISASMTFRGTLGKDPSRVQPAVYALLSLALWPRECFYFRPHLPEAPFPEHSQEGEVAEFDFVQADKGRLDGLAAVRLCDPLLTRAQLGFLHSGDKARCV